jgi:DNA-binding CsgD family transcriptional regulator
MDSNIWDSNGAIPMWGAPTMEVVSVHRAEEPVDARSVASISQLSPREREVLQELVDGRSHEAAAQDLFISPHTFRTHVKNILTKLGAHSSIEAVSIAVCAGVRPTRIQDIDVVDPQIDEVEPEGGH